MKDTWVQIRINKEEKERWQALAKSLGVSLSQLVRDAMEFMFDTEE